MINLLPPQYKEEIKAEETKRVIIALGLLILLALFCLIIILVFLKIYLLIQVGSQKGNLELLNKERQDSRIELIQEKIENANKKISEIDDFYNKKVNIVETIEELNRLTPEGIYLKELSYSKKDPPQIILAGFAPSRENLVQFRENLQKKEGFKCDEKCFPPSSWIEPVNINFTGVKIILEK